MVGALNQIVTFRLREKVLVMKYLFIEYYRKLVFFFPSLGFPPGLHLDDSLHHVLLLLLHGGHQADGNMVLLATGEYFLINT